MGLRRTIRAHLSNSQVELTRRAHLSNSRVELGEAQEGGKLGITIMNCLNTF